MDFGKKKKTRKSAGALTEEDNQLYELLRNRRNAEAEKEKVPPYVILDNKTLMELSAVRPMTEEEFLQVKGIGKIKTERYASLFIPIIRDYVEQHDNDTIPYNTEE